MKKTTDNEIQAFLGKPNKRPSVILPILLLSVLAIFLVLASDVESYNLFKEQNSVEPTESLPSSTNLSIEELEGALQASLTQRGGRWADNTWVIDQIQFNEEGNEALLWLAWLDPDTKAIIASEPQQAFARISSDMS
ncbi:MAG: hypothetical protein MUO40_11420, partial [Anaerolineaceae bacterium]|nr:hypothetical protein [Anaerolineaceae bacterium]